MVRRGSTVRVRQRAFVEKKSPEIGIFVVWHSTTERLRIGVGTAIELARAAAKCLQTDLLPGSTEHLPESEGLDVVAVAGSTGSRWKGRHSRSRCLGTNLGDRSWGQDEQLGRNPRGLRRPRSERADELEHVVGELPDTVRGGGLLTLNPVTRACVNNKGRCLTQHSSAWCNRLDPSGGGTCGNEASLSARA
jgi:hypothetical protein